MIEIKASGRSWSALDRLTFLWMASLAVKRRIRGGSYSYEETHWEVNSRFFDDCWQCKDFEDEAAAIGRLIAEDGFSEMIAMIDEIESIFGLNAGEWVSRRWTGIEAKGRMW